MNARPRLRPDIVIVEQTFQGERSYVFKDPATQKYYRFKPLEAFIIQQFDGEQTCAAIAAALAEQGLQLSAASVTAFARKIDRMGLFERSLQEKSVMLLERLRTERRRRLKGHAYEGSILRMRWSVGDPNAFFERWLPRLRFVFTPTFVGISLGIFLLYVLVVVTHWGALLAGLGGLINPAELTVGKIATIYLTMSVIVAFHELGHGFTCKYYGGDVHEIGAMLLYFEPAFFCNVNDAWTFPELRHRLWVTAAGSWVQLLMAALAAAVWLVVEPGTVIGNIALVGVVMAGGLALLGNANPLIPLDGYYALIDYLEIPNLRHRAFAHLSWWIKRFVMRLPIPEPPADDRERRVFLTYALLATLYIGLLFFYLGVKVFGFLGRTTGAVGVTLLALALAVMLRGRFVQLGNTIAMTVRQHRATWREHRVGWTIGAIILGVVLIALLVPWPMMVTGGFVVEPERSYALAAPDSAVIARVYVTEGATVSAGARLVQLRSFGLEMEQIALQRAVDSLDAELRQAHAEYRAGAIGTLEAQRAEWQGRLEATTARVRALLLRAPVAGIVATPRIEESVGAKVLPGDTVVEFERTDSVRVRIRLQAAGARYVQPGQKVALLSDVDRGSGVVATVAEVAARGDSSGTVDAYVFLPGGVTTFHPWATGEAKVTIRRSNILGALWWGVRKRLRNDLFL
jgi:putative peptide zinc metalloprotease protein